MSDFPYVVGIVVDPTFGDRIRDLVPRMPVWVADTDANRRAAEPVRAAASTSHHTRPGDITLFLVDPKGTPESWCADILRSVAIHHDGYSHDPGFSVIEVFGVEPTPRLMRACEPHRLTVITRREQGFVASTPDGTPALSPNEADWPGD